MINEISQVCKDYYSEIPANSLKSIGLSAIGTFCIGILHAGLNKPDQIVDLTRPFMRAGIVIVASTIHSLITPIFNYCFDNQGSYDPLQECAQVIVTICFTQVFINRFSPLDVNLLTRAFSASRNPDAVFFVMPSAGLRIIGGAVARIVSYIFRKPTIEREIQLVYQEHCGMNFSPTTPIYFAF